MKKIYTVILAMMFVTTISQAQSGITWSPAAQVAPSSSGNYHPRVTLDANNNPLVLFGHSQRAMFTRWNGTMFTAPIMVNTASISVASDTWMGPQIASKGDTVYVVMKRFPEAPDTNRLFIARSFNGGVTFSAPIEFGFIADSTSRFPTVTIDDTGNPIVGYMKFANSMNGNTSRWVVMKSTDYGSTFSVDVRASSMANPICDCCPGSIVNSGNRVAMLYRNNATNIRDMFAGVSNDNGATFPSRYDVDMTNWLITSCPASGPDCVIVGDSLYTIFMSSSSGAARVYYNKSSLTGMTSVGSTMITGPITGLSVQNYPRMANKGTAVAAVWKQSVSGNDQLGIRFTNNIANGFPPLWDTVDLNNITNADVAVGNGVLYVVWEDDAAGVVMYRKGTFNPSTVGVDENNTRNFNFEVYPNPAKEKATISFFSKNSEACNVRLTDIAGQEILSLNSMADAGENHFELNLSNVSKGIYFITIQKGELVSKAKIMVQ